MRLRCGMIAVVCACAASLLVAGLIPWAIRSKMAFGRVGLTTISGRNLYACNWGWMVDSFPEGKRSSLRADMASLDERTKNMNPMEKSQVQGRYARRQLLAHFGDYVWFTIKRHPRLYAGTGSIALLKYLGLDRVYDALDTMWGSGEGRGYVQPPPDKPYTLFEKGVGIALQVASWCMLLVCYGLVFCGFVKGFRNIVFAKDKTHDSAYAKLAFVCPVLCIVLVAIVIGPVTSTRYRFIMIPFFAMVAGYSCMPKRVAGRSLAVSDFY